MFAVPPHNGIPPLSPLAGLSVLYDEGYGLLPVPAKSVNVTVVAGDTPDENGNNSNTPPSNPILPSSA